MRLKLASHSSQDAAQSIDLPEGIAGEVCYATANSDIAYFLLQKEQQMEIAIRRRFAWLAALGLLLGCSTISPYSPTAYELSTSLKVEALATIDKASEPFVNHRQAVDALKINVEKAYEYAKGRPKNEETTKQCGNY